MQRLLILTASLAITCCAGATSDIVARQWLAAHAGQSPDELAELKGANPEAYALVKALLTKQSMGLIKRRSNSGSLSIPPPMPLESLEAPAGILVGPPAELAPEEPTAPPAMPPPPPISGPLPPSLEDTSMMVSDYTPPVHEVMSAAATRSSVSGGNFGLNYNPDKMMDENARMVQNVLGAVAQLTGKRMHHAANVEAKMPPVQNAVADVPPPRPLQPALPRRVLPTKALGAKITTAKATEKQSPADLYLASNEAVTGEDTLQSAKPLDEGLSGHLPGQVGWNNPYTTGTASTDAQNTDSTHENSYLKNIDLGVPEIRLPKRSSNEDNPYLQGLDLGGSSTAPTEESSLSASSLSDMHESQLLSSHGLLSYDKSKLDWDNDETSHPRTPQARKIEKAPQDPLSGFLKSKKKPVSPPPAAMVSKYHGVSKNAYMAKLGNTAAVSSAISSSLASSIEQDNPYLQALDPADAQPSIPEAEAPVDAQTNLRPSTNSVDKLAAFKWDDDQTQPAVAPRPIPSRHLSMTSSKVYQKQVGKAAAKKKGEKVFNAWLGGNDAPKALDPRTQRLRQVVAQRVADEKNPYLKGLDIDADAHSIGQPQENPYMASFN